MFSKILIANRGEIACRVARTARRMGISTVAVYSEADRHAQHVKHCDQAFLIGPAPAIESYLRADAIIEAALATGAQAIHPGYGFLSENADFAERCAENNLVFIGPTAEAIRAMGSKSQAKEIMLAANVPVLSGYQGSDQSAKKLKAAADETGYPVLIKAVSGGGGKGMRVVSAADEFDAALTSVKRESAASFADDRVLIEKYLPVVRHVEVQVFADQHGNCVHLFERDCSIQRRHQKVIEEAPAPLIDEQLRAGMGAAAVDAAKSIGYVGAGTVEFLLAPGGEFYFMEMNTRLQVEHPVTEMITGQDLVEWQLLVAAGQPLPRRQQDLEINGHAMEARIYAENPDNDFLPATGTLSAFHHQSQQDWLRVDSGVSQGDAILPYYDPMIAKLIVWGSNRDTARQRLAQALSSFSIAGVTTNLGFLHALTQLDDFTAPTLDTGLIPRNSETLFADKGACPEHTLALAALFEISQQQRRSLDRVAQSEDLYSPWGVSEPWQLNLPGEVTVTFLENQSERECILCYASGQVYTLIGEQRTPITLTPRSSGDYDYQCGRRLRKASVHKVAAAIHINMEGDRRSLTLLDKSVGSVDHSGDESGLTAPMPGTVIAVNVSENEQVSRGAPLLVLEAMKMEHTISAPHDGIVDQLFFREGDQVKEGDQLLNLSETEQ